MDRNPLLIWNEPRDGRVFYVSVFFALLGLLIFGFGLFFLITVFDQVWDGYNVWWLGIGWDSTFISIGLLLLNSVFNPSTRFPRLLVSFAVLSALLLMFGYAVAIFY